MNTEDFWHLIDESLIHSGGEQEAQLLHLRKHLLKLGLKEVIDFGREYDRLRNLSYSRKLWGAAYLINGGCSDDGFEYFRAWLISRGQKIFQSAIMNPDTLTDCTDPKKDSYEFEEILYLPVHVYEEITGTTDGYNTGIRFEGLVESEDWDFDDAEEMAKRYPNLYRSRYA